MTGTVCKCYYDMSKSTSEAIIPPPALTIQDNVIELSRNFTQNTSICTLFSPDKGPKINIFQKLYRYVFFVKYAWKKDRTNVRSLSFGFYCKVGTGRAAVVDACAKGRIPQFTGHLNVSSAPVTPERPLQLPWRYPCYRTG